jgi:hypothetical protein
MCVQINKSDEIAARTAARLAEAAARAAEQNMGSKSGLASADSGLKEGDRDPATGRLILDPLKIPTGDQGAPGSVRISCKEFPDESSLWGFGGGFGSRRQPSWAWSSPDRQVA